MAPMLNAYALTRIGTRATWVPGKYSSAGSTIWLTTNHSAKPQRAREPCCRAVASGTCCAFRRVIGTTVVIDTQSEHRQRVLVTRLVHLLGLPRGGLSAVHHQLTAAVAKRDRRR